MKHKKFLHLIGTFAVCFMLTGCCMNHEWTEATCTKPKTCAKCGETEGEALGHTWIDATCAEPKHCNTCGETEGEALAHTWIDATCAEPKHCSVCGKIEGNALGHTLTEANYQQAATCEVCGKTVGEPLQACFEKYGVVCNAELNTTYPYTLPCYSDRSYTTTGKVTFSDYDVFESDETHEALDGYEWKAVTYTIVFDDDNANNYGCSLHALIMDYYDDTFWDNKDNESETFSANYNGIEYSEIYFDSEHLLSGWNINGVYGYTSQYRVFFRLPKRYDGTVIVIYNPYIFEEELGLDFEKDEVDITSEMISKDNGAIFFRLQ